MKILEVITLYYQTKEGDFICKDCAERKNIADYKWAVLENDEETALCLLREHVVFKRISKDKWTRV